MSFLTSLNHKWGLFNIYIFRWNFDEMRANGDIFTFFSDASSKIEITDEMSLIFQSSDSNKKKLSFFRVHNHKQDLFNISVFRLHCDETDFFFYLD